MREWENGDWHDILWLKSPSFFSIYLLSEINELFFQSRHIPKAKATTIADTPELKRIAGNTKLQSNITYHAEFEKQKGKFTQVSQTFF